MQFLTFIQILATTAIVAAVPTPGVSSNLGGLEKRAAIFAADCGGTVYSRELVQSSFNALVSAYKLPPAQKPKAGTRAYPQQYGNNKGVPTDADVVTALDAIAGCKTGQPNTKFFEFPLANPVWNGGAQGGQGPDRVIAISPNIKQGETRTFTYCTAITHRGGAGSGDGSFRACKNA
ncbi:hypothetical protein BKA66DRAFT_513830 [Pyrenochaeta sp. MPI-SDFR-AT-0127]|nr:hypothetical protein BKA66DRAFT_513830 [Pyrenochaeta sp. MPI-SDFR-AT-0127]